MLLSATAFSQNPTNFPYGIKNPAAAENSTPTYFVTQEVDGVHKKTPAASISTPDATTTVKGKIQLAGDLSGTADAPTVPALANKADLVGGKVPASQLPITPTPTLQQVTQAGSISTVGIIVNESNGVGVYGNSTNGVGVYGNSTNGVGVYGNSTNGVGAIFGVENLSTKDITRFEKNGVTLAAVQNDGRILTKPGINPNDAVVKSQLDAKADIGSVIPITGTTAGNPVTGDLELQENIKIFTNNNTGLFNQGFILQAESSVVPNSKAYLQIRPPYTQYSGGGGDVTSRVEYNGGRSEVLVNYLNVRTTIVERTDDVPNNLNSKTDINGIDLYRTGVTTGFYGIKSNIDWSNTETLDKNIVAQRSYVDSAISGSVTPDATTTTKGKIKLAGDLSGTADAPTVPGLALKENTVTSGTAAQYYRGDKTWQTLDKTAVELSNVDDTSDLNKPISTATQTALDLKANFPTVNNSVPSRNASGAQSQVGFTSNALGGTLAYRTVSGQLKAITAIQPDDLTPLAQVQALVGNVTTVLATNTGASLGALNANTTVNLNLNTNSTWTTNTTASKTGATVAEIIDPTTGRIKDVADKNLNTIRVVIEYSQSGGAGDGVLTAQLVNPGNVVIDQESEPININGQAETNVRGTFRFFVVKTSDNDFGYTLRLNNGAKALTAYRIVSVLRNNNP